MKLGFYIMGGRVAEWRNFNKTFGDVFKLSLGYFLPCEKAKPQPRFHGFNFLTLP